jgi:hypothetical protein
VALGVAMARRRVAGMPKSVERSLARGVCAICLLFLPGTVVAQDEPPGKVAAQGEPRCRLICAPELKIEPTWTLPPGHWLKNIEAEVSLDYLATGLPKAGDIVGGERFVDKASPWSLSFVMVVPLAPLVP